MKKRPALKIEDLTEPDRTLSPEEAESVEGGIGGLYALNQVSQMQAQNANDEAQAAAAAQSAALDQQRTRILTTPSGLH